MRHIQLFGMKIYFEGLGIIYVKYILANVSQKIYEKYILILQLFAKIYFINFDIYVTYIFFHAGSHEYQAKCDKGKARCETPPSPPASDPVGIENCKQLFSPLLAFTSHKIATHDLDIIRIMLVRNVSKMILYQLCRYIIKYRTIKRSFSCKWVKKSIFFFSSLFDCICIQKYARKISGRNSKNCGSLSRHVRPPDSGTKNFKRVFLETMFFKLACTITEEQLDIFRKFIYRIKLY